MYELKIVTHFGAAHQLRDIGGKCESLHGHNWKIEVLLIDFRVMKKNTETIIERLDHKFLNELECFKDENPSSENIARYIYDELTPAFRSAKTRRQIIIATRRFVRQLEIDR